MFAQQHHSAMRHVGPTRVELGTRTIFNLLGPLSNPAGVTQQLVGVFAPQWLVPVAEVLRDLGSKSVWVVHGEGLDEITTTGVTQVAALENGEIRTFELTPDDFGLETVLLADLKGGDGAHNAAALKGVLEGDATPYRDISLANAAASLVIAGRADRSRRRHGTRAPVADKRCRECNAGAAHPRLERGDKETFDGRYSAEDRDLQARGNRRRQGQRQSCGPESDG